MEYIKKVADRIIKSGKDWGMNIDEFDWVPGVGLYGVLKAYKYTKDEKYLNFLIKWADTHLKDAYKKQTVNSTAPLLTILELYKITGKEQYLKVCIDIADYIITKAPITKDGGLEHTVTEPVEGFSDQVWADTLFMVCIFLTNLGTLVERKYSDFAIEQLKIHHKLLLNKDNGLYYHGWNGGAKNHMSGVCWARANAWIIYSTMEILNCVDDFEGRSEIEISVKNHSKALLTSQRENGGFGTVLDDTTSYDEISAVAGIAAGLYMAAKAGIVGDDCIFAAEKSISLIKENILDDGTIDNVSTGTPVMLNAQEYKEIEICPTLYGQGLVAIALTMCK